MKLNKSIDDVVNSKAYMELTEDNQLKVICIYELAIIYKLMKKGRITPRAFDSLYDTELDILTQYTDYCQTAYRNYKQLHNKIEWE